MLAAEPSPGWMAFSRLQHFVSSLPIDMTAWGRDEAVTDLIDDLVTDDLSPADVNRRFRGIALNRARKHRNRAQLYRDYAAGICGGAYHGDNQAPKAAAHELLELVRRAVTNDEWCILWRLAEGLPYDELSDSGGVSERSLRTRVSRLRERVRNTVGVARTGGGIAHT